jgi:hypothetical protein
MTLLELLNYMNWNRIIHVLMSWILHMWLKNLYENVYVDVKWKNYVCL